MRLSGLLVLLLLLAACGAPAQQAGAPTSVANGSGTATTGVGALVGALNITSTAFNEGAAIPRKYTCNAENVSPPLAWSGVPAGAKSLALIADDPDAPGGTWTHWVLFNLPATSTGLLEGIKPQDSPEGATQATTSFRKVGYGGPCPPSGTHRYYFRLYALGTPLSLASDCDGGRCPDGDAGARRRRRRSDGPLQSLIIRASCAWPPPDVPPGDGAAIQGMASTVR